MKCRYLKLLLIFLIIFGAVAVPFAKSQKSQNPAMLKTFEFKDKGPLISCWFVFGYDLWVDLYAGLFNDCTGNYAITYGTNAWWPGYLSNPYLMGGWAPFFNGWQYPKDFTNQQNGQIVYDHNIMWGAKSTVSDFLYESDIQSPFDSVDYNPSTFETSYTTVGGKELTGFGGFYYSSMNDNMENYSQGDFITFIDDERSKNSLGIIGQVRNLR